MKKSAIAAIISAITFAGTMGCDGVDGGTVSEEAILEDELDDSELSEFAAPKSKAEKDKPSFESDFDFTDEADPSAACLMCEDLIGVQCNPPNSWSQVCAWWITGGLCSGLDQLKCIDGVWQEQ